jgi:hypothetical protein
VSSKDDLSARLESELFSAREHVIKGRRGRGGRGKECSRELCAFEYADGGAVADGGRARAPTEAAGSCPVYACARRARGIRSPDAPDTSMDMDELADGARHAARKCSSQHDQCGRARRWTTRERALGTRQRRGSPARTCHRYEQRRTAPARTRTLSAADTGASTEAGAGIARPERPERMSRLRARSRLPGSGRVPCFAHSQTCEARMH